jgi:hypothetical protein
MNYWQLVSVTREDNEFEAINTVVPSKPAVEKNSLLRSKTG